MYLSENIIDPWNFFTIALLAQTFYKVFDIPNNNIVVLDNNWIYILNEELEWIEYIRF